MHLRLWQAAFAVLFGWRHLMRGYRLYKAVIEGIFNYTLTEVFYLCYHVHARFSFMGCCFLIISIIPYHESCFLFFSIIYLLYLNILAKKVEEFLELWI